MSSEERCYPYFELQIIFLIKKTTLSDIANLLGCSKSTVSKKLNGRSEFSLAEVEKICDRYNISPEHFRTLRHIA